MSKHIYMDYIEDVKHLYLIENLNIKEIAKKLNISISTVYRILVRYNIKKSKELAHIRRVNVYKIYGIDYWQKRNNKSKKTLQAKYGNSILNPSQIPGIQEKMHLPDSIRKAYETKRKNNTFNRSKIEDDIYNLLKNKFNIVERNYKSELYPFKCDFYIPKLDLYIEYQGHWSHGFDGQNLIGPYVDNIECKKILDKWKEKAKKSKFYKNAIETWTIRDPKKRHIAIENRLNWLEFFTFNDFMNWYKN